METNSCTSCERVLNENNKMGKKEECVDCLNLLCHCCGYISKSLKLAETHSNVHSLEKISYGERIASNYFIERQIPFKYNSSFYCHPKGRTGKGALRFDFIVEWKDSTVFVEIDGAYHSQMVVGWTALQNQRKNDKIKNNFANDLGIKMLRIDMVKFDVGHWSELDVLILEILDEHFN
jgi:hypothetical protein